MISAPASLLSEKFWFLTRFLTRLNILCYAVRLRL